MGSRVTHNAARPQQRIRCAVRMCLFCQLISDMWMRCEVSMGCGAEDDLTDVSNC